MSEEECTGVNSTVSHTGCFNSSITDRNGEVHEVSSMGPGGIPLEFKLGYSCCLETLPGGRVSGRIGDDPDAGIIDETFVEPEVVREGI
jgi:hypothetical protein